MDCIAGNNEDEIKLMQAEEATGREHLHKLMLSGRHAMFHGKQHLYRLQMRENISAWRRANRLIRSERCMVGNTAQRSARYQGVRPLRARWRSAAIDATAPAARLLRHSPRAGKLAGAENPAIVVATAL